MGDAVRTQTWRWCAVAAAFAVILGLSFAPASAQIAQQGSKLTPSGAIGSFLSFGKAVALSADGNTAIVGSPEENIGAGGARVFVRGNGSWTPQSLRLFPNDDNNTVGAGPSFGNAVALSADGNIAFIAGRRDNSSAGAVWVFTRTNGAWSQLGSKLTPSDATLFANFGQSVAASSDGNTIIVGGNNDNNNTGAAWIFTRSGNTWSQQGNKLKPNIGAASRFGESVALSSDGLTAIVGEPFRNISGVFGAAWVFVPISGTWVQQGNVLLPNDASNVAYSPSFAYSVAMSADGNLAVIGGPSDNTIGAAWIFTRNSNGGWNQYGSKLVSGDTNVFNPQFGSAVAVSPDGKTALIGEYAYSEAPNAHTGAAWLFTQNNGSWTKQGNRLVASDGNGPDFGTSVALSSDANTALIGGPFDSSSFGALFVLVQRPTITSVGPGVGLAGGGTAVTITGTGFTGASAVTFGGAAAAAFTVVDPNTITATTPAHAAGVVDVAVTNSIGTGTSADAFRFYNPTTTTLGSSLSPARVGQNVTFTATINENSATGTVTFKDGSSTLGSSPVNAGVATFQTSSLPFGSHSITAIYNGDAAFDGSTSSALDQTIVKGATATTLGSSPNPAIAGQNVTLTAALNESSATGTITFKDGASTLGSAPVNAGIASLSPTSLALGSHLITATYSGDGAFDGSASSVLTQTVNKGATTTTVSASPSLAKPGQAVIVKAKIAVAAPASMAPTGSVTFRDGPKKLGSASIVSGRAQLSITGLALGTHVIAASYGGNNNLSDSSATTTAKISAALGAETKVNKTTKGVQQFPAVAALKSGYVVAWASNNQDKSGYGIYFQRYDAAGHPLGKETLVNTYNAKDQTQPAVAGLKSGFVVVWQSAGEDKSGLGIYGQRYDSKGKRSGKEFKVNAKSGGDQFSPSVATLTSGDFVVAWTSKGQDESGLGVCAQLYNSKGKADGKEFKVNRTTKGNQTNSSVTGLKGGGFVVAWQGSDANGLGIYMQRYDASGEAQGKETLANKTTLHDQSLPSVAGLHNGGFIIAWQSALQDGHGLGVYAQRFTAKGAKSGGETRANTTTVDDQGSPSVAAFTDGGYLIAWMSNRQDGSKQGVYAQGYTDKGASVNVEFPVTGTTAGNQNQPAVAAFTDGKFVVVWTSANDGNGQGIYSQRFALPGTH